MKRYFKLFFVAILLFLLVTGCESNTLSKNSSIEELLNTYMEGFKNGDTDKMLSIYPDFVIDYYKKQMTKEAVKQSLSNYGDDIKMSYEIASKEKLTEDELNELNDSIKQTFTNYVLPTECYKIMGTTSIKGSNYENTNEIDRMWYCNFDGTWRLLEDL